MFDPKANDPYGQPPFPYQPYGAHARGIDRRNEPVSPPPTSRASLRVRSTQVNARPVTPCKSKAEALALAHEFKKWLVAGSVITFGLLGGLVAGHAVGTTATQPTPASNAPSTSPSSGGGFFQQGPQGQQQQGQQQGGGYGFGNGNFGQPPVSGSHTS
jgi:hypothetical protein